MTQQLIFWPMGALALLTFAVLGVIPARRFAAGRAGEVSAEDFALGESARVPAHVALPNRNYMNLLELPTLFYPVCLMFYVAGKVDAVALTIAWAFVVLRLAHSVIHLTYNNVMHRLTPFAISNFVLMALWVWFFIR